MSEGQFHLLLYGMSILAVIVFIILYFVDAGYGMFRTPKWGVTVSNKVGWILMESPVFLIMLTYWLTSDRKFTLPFLVFFLLFQLHYFNRAFIFPFMIKGKSRMPVVIMLSAVLFNLLNGLMQGEWIFHQSSTTIYTETWLTSPCFITGTLLFFIGMGINLHSDRVIRNLRKPGDTNHYLPAKGLYKYVTSANYFGEQIEWIGFAILTWSPAGLVFALWTFANLVPRANAIYHKYEVEFGGQMGNRKRMFPFIY
ncbi:MAG: DUF1295 domain-containing protein [Tannerellaceae bacterium]|nr:DUF1295 domain-containing protein [Tannerellaceae bacterium]